MATVQAAHNKNSNANEEIHPPPQKACGRQKGMILQARPTFKQKTVPFYLHGTEFGASLVRSRVCSGASGRRPSPPPPPRRSTRSTNSGLAGGLKQGRPGHRLPGWWGTPRLTAQGSLGTANLGGWPTSPPPPSPRPALALPQPEAAVVVPLIAAVALHHLAGLPLPADAEPVLRGAPGRHPWLGPVGGQRAGTGRGRGVIPQIMPQQKKTHNAKKKPKRTPSVRSTA